MNKTHALSGLALTFGLALGPMAAAGWADNPAYTSNSPTCALPGGGTAPANSPQCTQELGTTATHTPAAPAVGPATATNTASLPFTGAEIGLMSTAAAAAIGTGAVLAFASRRRRND